MSWLAGNNGGLTQTFELDGRVKGETADYVNIAKGRHISTMIVVLAIKIILVITIIAVIVAVVAVFPA